MPRSTPRISIGLAGRHIVTSELWCPEGVGPLHIVNEKIFELGIRRYLPARYQLFLVSGMDAATVRGTYAAWSPSVEAALLSAKERHGSGEFDVVVIPDASDLVPVR